MKPFLLFSMLFCHVIDDFTLQGWLADAKKRSWWEQNCPQEQYRFDYLAALAAHCFSWTFMIMLPIAIYMHFSLGWLYLAYLPNFIIHFIVDDLKANKNKISLVIDQSIHVIRILITWLVFSAIA